jgi:N-acetylmuramoyl-L-alanine amidase
MADETKITWLLDNGHGGIIDGAYQTEGKRSPVWPDGSQLFEGEFNRSIVARLIAHMSKAGYNYVNLTPEHRDISLGERVRRANGRHNGGTCILVSIHANAGGGTGYEIFTSKGDTLSDRIADTFYAKFAEEFPEATARTDTSDGDLDKEENFYILKNTYMPAILTECFFMDTEADCQLLMSPEGRDRIARAHFKAIKHIEGNGIGG